jgi:hypothetical protein
MMVNFSSLNIKKALTAEHAEDSNPEAAEKTSTSNHTEHREKEHGDICRSL